jgi:hypothetical protein
VGVIKVAPSVMITTWIASDVTGDLQQVPFVGDKTVECLERAGIETSFQLLGAFLLLRKTPRHDATTETSEAFAEWLVDIGVHRSLVGRITGAVGVKLATWMPECVKVE